jgi:predicted O-linked N-acetylglucosamine transferase (SPINDLY family)
VANLEQRKAGPDDPESLYERGVALAQFGRLQEAEDCYRRALAGRPDDAATHNKLGVVLSRSRRFCDAERCFRDALHYRPDFPEARNNLANVLAEQGDHEQAERYYREAIALNSAYAEAFSNLGGTLRCLNRLDEAEQAIRQALALNPRFADAYTNLGTLLLQGNRLAAAADSYWRALALKPADPTAHNHLAIALARSGRTAEAEASFRKALELDPGYAEAHNNLGNLLASAGRLDEAEQCLLRTIALAPQSADGYVNLGNILKDTGRLDDAEKAYREAIRLQPGSYGAHNNLGIALGEMGRPVEAEQCYRRALSINPGFADSLNNLGHTLKDTGRLEEAEHCFLRTLELEPRNATAFSNLLMTLNYIPGRGAGEIFEAHKAFGRVFDRTAVAAPHANVADPRRRLRIGYVSADFRHHVVGFFMEPVLAHHDHGAFEVTCYYNFPRADQVTRRIKSYADRWRDVSTTSDEALAQLIREDAIDILIDLGGHTARNRLPALGLRPAPLQMTYLGYPTTTGLSTIDYRLTDAVTDPVGESERWNSERLIRLPGVMWCYRPRSELPIAEPAPRRAGSPMIFASLNNWVKINREVIAVWARVLSKVSGARLVLTSVPSEASREALFAAFASHGVRPERIDAYFRLSPAKFGELFSYIDIALDPFPYGGTTTTCDVLWMGLPVVTLTGATSASRSTASLLQAIGLEDLVTRNPEQYVDAAAALASDEPRVTRLRVTLRQRMKASPLMDEPGFTCNLESAYRAAWRSCCENQRGGSVP